MLLFWFNSHLVFFLINCEPLHQTKDIYELGQRTVHDTVSTYIKSNASNYKLRVSLINKCTYGRQLSCILLANHSVNYMCFNNSFNVVHNRTGGLK